MKPNDNDKKTASEEGVLTARAQRVGVDINIARYPIFASRSTRGFRRLPARVETVNGQKITRTVSVGTYLDTSKTLDTFDELVFMSIYGAWERAGCKMEDLRIVAALTHTLALKNLPMIGSEEVTDGKKRPRFAAHQFRKLRESLDKLSSVGIKYDESFEKKSGWSTETITLLKKVKLFNRIQSLKEGGRYFEMTELHLNEDICQNIKDKKFKLFYLEELAAIRGEAGKLMYNRLELLGGVVVSPFRRDALEFAKECGIEINPKHERKTIQILRRACEELTKRILTCGVIDKCYIENVATSGRTVHRVFVCHITKVKAARRINVAGRIPSVADHGALRIEAERAADRRLMDRFETLPESIKAGIRERSQKINRAKYGGFQDAMSTSLSLIESIREFFSLKNLDAEVKSIALREPASESPYLGASDYASALIDAIFPTC